MNIHRFIDCAVPIVGHTAHVMYYIYFLSTVPYETHETTCTQGSTSSATSTRKLDVVINRPKFIQVRVMVSGALCS